MDHQEQHIPKSDSNSIYINNPSSMPQADPQMELLISNSHSPQEEENKYKKYQGLMKNKDIWKTVIDGKDHAFGKLGYDNARKYIYIPEKAMWEPMVTEYEGVPKKYIDQCNGEPGYLENMLNALKYMFCSLGQIMTPDKYLLFHKLAVNGVKNMDSNKSFREKEPVYFNLSTSNSSIEGIKEWEKKKSSDWKSDKFTKLNSIMIMFNSADKEVKLGTTDVINFLWFIVK